MAFTPQSFSNGNILNDADLNTMDGNIDEVRAWHKGPLPPPSLVPGVRWLDDSKPVWIEKIYDGTAFIAVADIVPGIGVVAPVADIASDPLVRFEYQSPTECRLNRADGAEILLLTAGVWQQRPIPAGGVAIGNGGLSINTLYYAYAAWSGTAVSLELSTTAPTNDVERHVRVKTGDPTRRLVGMLHTLTPVQFLYSPTQRLVLSWCQRRALFALRLPTVNASVISTSLVPLSFVDFGIEFLSWDIEDVTLRVEAVVSNTTGLALSYLGILVDSLVAAGQKGRYAIGQHFTADGSCDLTNTYIARLPQGYHYMVPAGATSTATSTYLGSTGGMMIIANTMG